MTVKKKQRLVKGIMFPVINKNDFNLNNALVATSVLISNNYLAQNK